MPSETTLLLKELEHRPRLIRPNVIEQSGCFRAMVGLVVVPGAIAGLALLGWLVVLIGWAALGVDLTATVTGFNRSTGTRGRIHHRVCFNYSHNGATFSDEQSISRGDYEALSARPEPRMLGVRVVAIGSWRYAAIIEGLWSVVRPIGSVGVLTVLVNLGVGRMVWIGFVAPARRRRLYR